MSTTRIALGVSYNGHAYHGWQTQPHGNTVQDVLQTAILQFTQHPLELVCAGRTDTGVHACQQVVHLDSPVQRSQASWVRGLNALLPPSIRIHWASPVPPDFHARFSATSRTYVYLLRNRPTASALWQGQVGWDFHPLDLKQLQAAAQLLVGEHDFSSFRSSQCQAHSPVRTLSTFCVHQQGDLFIFVLKANAFLHHMVRNIMGCMVYVGSHRHDLDWLERVLHAKDRTLAAPTFMPDGLYLAHVDYPSSFDLPMPAFSMDHALDYVLQQ